MCLSSRICNTPRSWGRSTVQCIPKYLVQILGDSQRFLSENKQASGNWRCTRSSKASYICRLHHFCMWKGWDTIRHSHFTWHVSTLVLPCQGSGVHFVGVECGHLLLYLEGSISKSKDHDGLLPATVHGGVLAGHRTPCFSSVRHRCGR